MSKRSVVFLVLSALLLTGFSVSLSRRDSRDWRANRSRRLMSFPWQDTVSIAIRRPGGEEVRFFRSPGKEWQTTFADGLADTVDPGTVEELAALAILPGRDPLPDRSPPDPAAATVLTAQNQFGQSVTLTFGEVVHNQRATCIDGDTTVVYGVSQDLLGFLDWPQERFRKLYLASVAGGHQPRKILLEPEPGNADTATLLESGPQGWSMRAPVEWPVDESRLDHLLRWLDRLRADVVVAETADDPAAFGFDPPGAALEAWFDTPDGQVHTRIEFGGDDGSGGVYARVAGRSPTFSLHALALSEIPINDADDNPVAWRNYFRRRLLNLIGGKVPAGVVVEQLLSEPVTLRIDFDRVAGAWQGKLESGGGQRTFTVDPPDPKDRMRPLTALFTGLSGLRIKEFLADEPPGPDTLRWTAYPAWRIGMRFDDGTSAPDLVLYANDALGTLPAGAPFVDGSADPQNLRPLADTREAVGVAFAVADRPAVLETFAQLAYFLCLPPYRYQSRHILDESPAGWRRVDLTREGKMETFIRPESEVNEQWWRQDSASEPLMDGNNRFVAMLQSLSQLDSDGFVSDVNGDIAEFGLDRPEITAIVYSSPEPSGEDDESAARLFELSLGKSADKEGRRYARLNGAGPVFLLPAGVSSALGEQYE